MAASSGESSLASLHIALRRVAHSSGVIFVVAWSTDAAAASSGGASSAPVWVKLGRTEAVELQPHTPQDVDFSLGIGIPRRANGVADGRGVVFEAYTASAPYAQSLQSTLARDAAAGGVGGGGVRPAFEYDLRRCFVLGRWEASACNPGAEPPSLLASSDVTLGLFQVRSGGCC